MRLLRRIVFWVLMVAFGASILAWGLYIPHRPSDLYRAIPANASYVSAHFNIASRWPSITENPVTRSLLLSLGLDDENILDAPGDPVVQRWLNMLATRETVFAFVPSLGPDNEPAWVFASWLGGRSQQMRWSLYWDDGESIDEVFSRTGHHIWMIDPASTKSGNVVSFSLVEGMLVGSISRRAATTATVLECFDGVYPSVRQTRSERLMPVPTAEAPDRGWFGLGKGGGIMHAYRATFEIDALKGSGLSARIRLPWSLPASTDVVARASFEDLTPVLDGHPVAFVAGDAAIAKDVLRGYRSMLLFGALRNLVTDLGCGEVGLAVLSGDLSGRYKGIKLPTLLAALPTGGRTGATAVVQTRLDILNAQSRWGLIPQTVSMGDVPVYAIQSTADTPYARFPLEEQLGYTEQPNWLLLASNVEGLTNLLSSSATSTASWAEATRGDEPIRAWIDLERGAKAIRVALTAYAVKLVAEQGEKSQPMRQRINEWKAWVDAMSPLGELRVVARNDGDETEIRLEAGRKGSTE